MKNFYFELYSLVFSIFGLAARIILISFASLFFLTEFSRGSDLRLPFSIFAFILINELFLDHLSRLRPAAFVRENPRDLLDAMTFSARKAFLKGETSYKLILSLKEKKEVEFFMEKLDGLEISEANISKAELLNQAFELVKWVKGDYITEIDLYASYILLSDTETHALSKIKIDNDDLINVLYWTGRKFAPDVFNEKRIVLIGPGVFDSLVHGWNFELKKYSRDLTWQVLSRHFPPNVVGAEKAYDELVVGLSKHKSSNVIIVGEPGTGKTALVENLAFSAFLGKTPRILVHKKVYELFADKLLSGVTSTGELEARVSAVLLEIAASGDSIIFIRNIENIFGGGGLGLDISGVLEEYMNSSRVKIVGTTTPSGYANFIQDKTSIADLFEKIETPEPQGGQVMLLLTEKAREIESKYHLLIKYSALKHAVLEAPVYFPDRFYPGSAVDLLEDVASRASNDNNKIIDGDDVLKHVEGKTKVALSEPDQKEKELLLALETKIHERVIGQDEAVKAVSDAMRRVRSGFSSHDRPISTFLFLGPTGVGKTETAKALASVYFGSEDSMIRLDMSEYQTQDQIDRLLGSKVGEEYTPNSLVEKISDNPFSLILLDEFEKADAKLLNLFLQVFDEGRLTDNHGKSVSFKNCIIIATSNAGSELIRERQNGGGSIAKEELVDDLLKNNVFTPELVNRFDDVIVFKPLNQEEIKKIAEILLKEEFKNISHNQINIKFDENILSKIANDSYNPEFGARNIRRYIEDNVESFVSKLILEDKIKPGEVNLSVDNSGSFVVT